MCTLVSECTLISLNISKSGYSPVSGYTLMPRFVAPCGGLPRYQGMPGYRCTQQHCDPIWHLQGCPLQLGASADRIIVQGHAIDDCKDGLRDGPECGLVYDRESGLGDGGLGIGRALARLRWRLQPLILPMSSAMPDLGFAQMDNADIMGPGDIM